MRNAGEFLKALARVTDSETRRKTIGALFIDMFEREARKIGYRADYLPQQSANSVRQCIRVASWLRSCRAKCEVRAARGS